MKKNLIILTAVLLATMQLMADNIDLATARTTAQRFLTEKASSSGRFKAPSQGASLTLIHAEPSQVQAGQAVYYIFNSSDSYIIVPGDDRAQEVLAYGDRPLDMNAIPDAMHYWLNNYKQQVEYLFSHPGMVVEQAPRRAPRRQVESVEPLLTTLWDQSYPYNLECPSSSGSRCLTGCPATSLSMVFYYWKYPTGITPAVPGYVTSSLHLRLEELPPTTFDWDNMLDVYRGGYNNDQARAVAHLMRYLGQAEEMDYTPSASGSYGENILETAKLFGYSPDAELIYKSSWWYDYDNYSDEEWADIIQEELYCHRPLVMCAYANGIDGLSGHAFNIDGYDGEKDMYHINWGWSGSSNAHFALNAFRGGGSTFNYMQQLIIGLEPPATVPTIKVNRKHVNVSSYIDSTSQVAVTVRGALLTGDVHATLHDNTGTFALQQSQISLASDRDSKQLTLSYTPSAMGQHTATITLSSDGAQDVTIDVTGTAILETYTPEMTEASEVQASSFLVNWTDRTPAHNVSCYNLETASVPYSELCLHEEFTSLNPTTSADCSGKLDDITATAGWTGFKVYQGQGYLRLGNNSSKGWLETPALDMRDSQGLVTVKVLARAAGKNENALLKITCGDHDTTLLVTADEKAYCVLMPCNTTRQVKVRLSNSLSNLRVIITGVEVFAGNDYSVVDESTIKRYDGIMGHSFEIDGVTPGTYATRVQALYTDGSTSQWSNRQRVEVKAVLGDLNNDGVVNISDINVLINVVLGNNGSPRTIHASDLNGDGTANIADVNLLINKIL